VPPEGVDLTFYLLVKDKTENQVGNKLTVKGWIEKQNQEEVFETTGVVQTCHEANKV
jgi:hypothetical protein